MPWFRIILLVGVLAVTSGYRFRCYFMCVDQTSTQNDYVEQRDHCREYAELKIDMAMHEAGVPPDDKSRKSQLVSLFSQCMANNGWTVPDGRGEGGVKSASASPSLASQNGIGVMGSPTATSVSVPTPAIPSLSIPTPAMSAAQHLEEKSALTRASECAFARQSRDVSSNSYARAQACDLECAAAVKLAPGAPRPPSCPPDLSSRLAIGNEN